MRLARSLLYVEFNLELFTELKKEDKKEVCKDKIREHVKSWAKYHKIDPEKIKILSSKEIEGTNKQDVKL